jgi:hypothetical protein
MKVYSALEFIDYEGSTLLGVFASRDEAVAHIKTNNGYKSKWAYSYGVIESELGQAIDVFASVDRIE